MVRDTLIKQPRLRRPDTLFIPHHIQLLDRGPRVSPLRAPWRQKLLDWWVFDDARSFMTHEQLWNSPSQRIFSRTGSGRYIAATDASTCRARFLSRTPHIHAALAGVNGFIPGFDIEPSMYEFSVSESFTIVFVYAVVALTSFGFFGYREKLPGTSLTFAATPLSWVSTSVLGTAYRSCAHETSTGSVFYILYPQGKTIVLRELHTTSDSALMTLSSIAGFPYLVMIAIDYEPTTSRFTPAQSSFALSQFINFASAGEFPGDWNVGGDTLRLRSIRAASQTEDNVYYFYEMMVFKPRLSMGVRGHRYSYYRGDEFEELVYGYFVPRYRLHRNSTYQAFNRGAVDWPFIRRFPGDSQNLPRLCPGSPIRYSLSRTHPYGLRRLGPETLFQAHNRHRIFYCAVADEDWAVGSPVGGKTSLTYNSIPLVFEQK